MYNILFLNQISIVIAFVVSALTAFGYANIPVTILFGLMMLIQFYSTIRKMSWEDHDTDQFNYIFLYYFGILTTNFVWGIDFWSVIGDCVFVSYNAYSSMLLIYRKRQMAHMPIDADYDNVYWNLLLVKKKDDTLRLVAPPSIYHTGCDTI